jgi:hypothetical protein
MFVIRAVGGEERYWAFETGGIHLHTRPDVKDAEVFDDMHALAEHFGRRGRAGYEPLAPNTEVVVVEKVEQPEYRVVQVLQ